MTVAAATIGLPFIPGYADLRPFLADLVLIAGIVAVLLAPFFTRRANLAAGVIALATLVLAFLSLFVTGTGPDVTGPHFRNLLVLDPFAVLWQATLYLFSAGIVLMWFSTTAETMHEGDGPEFFTLLLGAVLGMSLMATTANLLMIFLALELASFPSYVLAGFRKTHRLGAEAALKYVLFGAAATAVMAYGLSLLYGLYGTLDIPTLATTIAAAKSNSALLAVALGGLIVGVGFKISAVPFHFWCPDVFEGATIDVAAFLSVASKGAALALLLRVLLLIATPLHYAPHAPGLNLTALAGTIAVLGALTATVGNTAAFPQTNVKRLLAYSSIAHAGYILCALSLIITHNTPAATPVDASSSSFLVHPSSLSASPAAHAVLFYLIVYLFMNLGAFTAAAAILRRTGSETITDYAALGTRAPTLAFAFLCCLISLTGLPPFAGFTAKLYVMLVLANNGGWWWSLVVVIGLNTVVSAFYYFRVVRAMYLTPLPERPGFPMTPEARSPSSLIPPPSSLEPVPLRPNPLATALSLTCGLVLVLLLLAYSPVDRLTRRFAQLYLSPPPPTSPTSALATATPTTPNPP